MPVAQSTPLPHWFTRPRLFLRLSLISPFHVIQNQTCWGYNIHAYNCTRKEKTVAVTSIERNACMPVYHCPPHWFPWTRPFRVYMLLMHSVKVFWHIQEGKDTGRRLVGWKNYQVTAQVCGAIGATHHTAEHGEVNDVTSFIWFVLTWTQPHVCTLQWQHNIYWTSLVTSLQYEGKCMMHSKTEV